MTAHDDGIDRPCLGSSSLLLHCQVASMSNVAAADPQRPHRRGTSLSHARVERLLTLSGYDTLHRFRSCSGAAEQHRTRNSVGAKDVA